MHALPLLADALNTLAWGLYIHAQWRGGIKASAVNSGFALLITFGIFLATKSLSTTSISTMYAISTVAMVVSFLLALKNPVKLVRSDLPLGVVAALTLALVHRWPSAVTVITGMYFAFSYASYIAKLRAGVVQEQFQPWAFWVAGGVIYLVTLGHSSPYVYINPLIGLTCWSIVLVLTLRARRAAALPGRAAAPCA
jgi:hypothetical protein